MGRLSKELEWTRELERLLEIEDKIIEKTQKRRNAILVLLGEGN